MFINQKCAKLIDENFTPLVGQIRAESTFEAPTFLVLIFFRNKRMLLMLR